MGDFFKNPPRYFMIDELSRLQENMMNWRHGGNIRQISGKYGITPDSIKDFSANINPFGPPEWLRMTISSAVSDLVIYPDPDCSVLKDKIASHYGISVNETAVGNGSSELLYYLPKALGVRRSIIPVPCYVDYISASEASNLGVETVPILEKDDFEPDFECIERKISAFQDERLLVIIGHPNNPTGKPVNTERLRKTAHKHPDTFFLVDEAFGDFVRNFESLALDRPENVIVLKSMTKIYAIPGLRLGYCLAAPEIIRSLEKIMPPWRLGAIGLAVAEAAFDDKSFIPFCIEQIEQLRTDLVSQLSVIRELKIYDSCANYILARIEKKDIDAYHLAERLSESGIAIRICDNYENLDSGYFRVAVKTEKENRFLADALKRVFGYPCSSLIKKKKPALMIQGTASNAGKSLITAALCRILARKGIRVAPFKAQNMSLNSFVTRDGHEMATAQALQARACMLDPDVRMNPVLVKPSSDVAGQIIINGKPAGKINASAYFDYRKTALEAIRNSYDSLSEEYEAIVIEGAGSPAEVNLKKNDITNMNMALYAEAPVLVAGDIDRGGVFASFIGSMETFTEAERKLVSGFIVNKFRGESALLKDAFDYVEKHTGKITMGVIPYIKDLRLPEEDSVNLSENLFNTGKSGGKAEMEICVINLPHFSNFTDFDAFQVEDDVVLRLADSPDDIKNPDAIIIPGSKNVISDLVFLEKTGLGSAIKKAACEGNCMIIGICGGYQMLGHIVEDPFHVESEADFHPGLGLLDVRTVLEKEKKLARISARHVRSGENVNGYEIHHGVTISDEPVRMLEIEGTGDHGDHGAENPAGNISGVYMHGFFDSDRFRRWFLNNIRIKKGLSPVEKTGAYENLVERELDRLADIVESSLDIARIYRLMGL